MQQEQVILYIRENLMTIAMVSGGIVLGVWLLILFQVTRTRREVHKICKKIRRYFDVILAEDPKEEQQPTEEPVSDNTRIPVYQVAEEPSIEEQKAEKSEEDIRLLMDVISEVF